MKTSILLLCFSVALLGALALPEVLAAPSDFRQLTGSQVPVRPANQAPPAQTPSNATAVVLPRGPLTPPTVAQTAVRNRAQVQSPSHETGFNSCTYNYRTGKSTCRPSGPPTHFLTNQERVSLKRQIDAAAHSLGIAPTQIDSFFRLGAADRFGFIYHSGGTSGPSTGAPTSRPGAPNPSQSRPGIASSSSRPMPSASDSSSPLSPPSQLNRGSAAGTNPVRQAVQLPARATQNNNPTRGTSNGGVQNQGQQMPLVRNVGPTQNQQQNSQVVRTSCGISMRPAQRGQCGAPSPNCVCGAVCLAVCEDGHIPGHTGWVRA